jgi:hypothetical protein
MVTLTIILLLLFVPASRRLLSDIFSAVLFVLGIAFLVTRESRTRRRGF